jgi:ribosomal protein S18 acetylase RimI-like enzyme
MSLLDRTICEGGSADRAELVDTLSSAFQHDPALSWILPDPTQRRFRLPKLFEIVVRSELAAGSALRSNAFEVVTLWRAPGKAHVGLVETVLSGFGYLQTFGAALGRAKTVLRAMESHHPKGNSYWYLHYAGVRPDHQGKGWGSAAIRQGLTRARSGGLPVYLETAKESNVVLYRSLDSNWLVSGMFPKEDPISGPCSAKIKLDAW